MSPDDLTPARIEAAAERLRGHVRRTPVIEVDGADVGLPGIELVFKLEFLQHGGSFKARGALTHLLTREVPQAGVVAASGGNHGVAVAFAAQRMGKPATVFVPAICSPAKLAQIAHHGAQVQVGGERYADALAASQVWQQETGALAIHAFDQFETLLHRVGDNRIAFAVIDKIHDDSFGYWPRGRLGASHRGRSTDAC